MTLSRQAKREAFWQHCVCCLENKISFTWELDRELFCTFQFFASGTVGKRSSH